MIRLIANNGKPNIFATFYGPMSGDAVCLDRYMQTCQDVHGLLITPYLIVKLIHVSCDKREREKKER